MFLVVVVVKLATGAKPRDVFCLLLLQNRDGFYHGIRLDDKKIKSGWKEGQVHTFPFLRCIHSFENFACGIQHLNPDRALHSVGLNGEFSCCRIGNHSEVLLTPHLGLYRCGTV